MFQFENGLEACQAVHWLIRQHLLNKALTKQSTVFYELSFVYKTSRIMKLRNQEIIEKNMLLKSWNIQTPKGSAVVILKFEHCGLTKE